MRDSAVQSSIYHEAKLPEDIKPYIHKMWYSYVGIEQLKEVYLPRPFPFFVVLLKGQVEIELVGDQIIASPLISINGTMKDSRAVLHFKDPIESIGIDLTSHGYVSLFGESPSHLSGKTRAISEVLPINERAMVDAINSHGLASEKMDYLLQSIKPYFKPFTFDQRVNHPDLASIIADCNYQVGELADKMCISEKTLNRLCQEYIGTSPKNYINIVRVNRAYATAKNLPNMTTQEVAHKFGFFDVQHMAKTFKHYLGLNLIEFRDNRSDEASSIWAN